MGVSRRGGGGEQARLESYFEGDPKGYETVLCHPAHIYYAHTMRVQKRDLCDSCPHILLGKDTQQNRPKYDENPEGMSPGKGQNDLTQQMVAGLGLEEGAGIW